MDDIRVFGYCESCGENVTDANSEYYVDEDGNVFDCVECALEYHGVTKVEI